jgi:hypothetical protein
VGLKGSTKRKEVFIKSVNRKKKREREKRKTVDAFVMQMGKRGGNDALFFVFGSFYKKKAHGPPTFGGSSRKGRKGMGEKRESFFM